MDVLRLGEDASVLKLELVTVLDELVGRDPDLFLVLDVLARCVHFDITLDALLKQIMLVSC